MPDLLAVTLLTATALFALANGANDGGALIAVGLKLPVFRPWQAIVIMATALGAGPYLFGTAVATTLATRMVSFNGPRGDIALLAALLATAGVVLTLTRRGIPTSLTLAIVGGIVGAGLGSDLPVAWPLIGTVLIVAAIAPLAGTLLSYTVTRLLGLLRPSANNVRTIGALHAAAFLLLCLAYGANDGQKMLAVFAIGGGITGAVTTQAYEMLVIVALFAVGAIFGLRRLGVRFGSGVLAARPIHAVSAELSAASAVLGSAAVGSPVSMTQALVGGLVGTGISDGMRRVRWRTAGGIVAAWFITLPAAIGASAALALLGQAAL
ncbi:MAG: inorganic phosphate transporter [Actinobacteria bacterium]|jgi:PiT family inorganic phosphate transporter|nr:inorganic phosphate transporter [Actinomycetota bacterium]